MKTYSFTATDREDWQKRADQELSLGSAIVNVYLRAITIVVVAENKGMARELAYKVAQKHFGSTSEAIHLDG